MIKTLAKSIREYKLTSILTLIFIMGEVVIEATIPFLTRDMINSFENLNGSATINDVLITGLKLVGMAIISLFCGGIAAITCAKASAGFAKNLRFDMFSKIQSYSFKNVDKFSSTSLVTRLTTDVTNVQMSYMMIIRTAVRSPMLFIFSVIMAYKMGGSLATTFVVVVPILIFGLLFVARKAMPAFRRVFKKYDRLNESIEENVHGMRVVKGFSREDYEKEKFRRAADDITADFTKAERIVAINGPLMQFCMYFNMIFILIVGSFLAISSQGSKIQYGEISAMLTYSMQILMSLMMLSMIYVMITMSMESMKRICEVLTEEPSIVNCENPLTEVKDGSVSFKNVNFKYSEKADRNALENIN